VVEARLFNVLRPGCRISVTYGCRLCKAVGHLAWQALNGVPVDFRVLFGYLSHGTGDRLTRRPEHWTNQSVRRLAGDEDPIAAIVAKARKIVFDALDRGWTGPPFEPFDLAERLGLELIPNQDVRDARILPLGRDRFRLEYNPNRPLHRVRYSVAHEIAHTVSRLWRANPKSLSLPRIIRGFVAN
jgi:hypothetical protein